MRKMKHWLTTIAVLLCSITASAETLASGSCGENLTWNLTEEGELIIEGTGAMYDYSYNDGNVAPWFEYRESITTIIIGEGVTSIGNQAFYDCSCLTSITLPDEMTSIGGYAFQNCSNLTSITLPESVTSIGGSAFYGCSLTSVNIPEGLISLGREAFCGCKFTGCITIPASLTSIGIAAFANAGKILEFVVAAENEFYDSRNGCNAIIETSTGVLIVGCASTVIPEGVTSIGYGAFAGCEELVSVIIPDGVTSIDYLSFHYCSNLTSVTIPESVTIIHQNAFAECESLTSIECRALTPPSIFDSSTFRGVDKSIPVYVPSVSVEAYKSAVGWSEFTNIQAIPTSDIASGSCGTNLTWKLTDAGELIIEGTGPMSDCFYEQGPWYGYRESIIRITIPEGLTSIGNYAFQNCSSLTTIAIPEGVTSIGDGAFSGCSSLASITIPESVTEVGYNPFSGSTWYNEQPDGVVYLDDWLIGYKGIMSSNTSIDIKQGTKGIAKFAFSQQPGLLSITIPASVTDIVYGAFHNCPNLASIKVSEANAVYDSRNGCNAIIETGTNTLIVGCSSTIIPENIMGIGDFAFRGCYSLTAINIPEGVTSIGDYAFSGCHSLTSITLPGSLTGDFAFSSCRSLTSITIPKGSVGFGAFSGCEGLTSITIGKMVTHIGTTAFYGCDKIEKVYVLSEELVQCAASAFPTSVYDNAVLYVPAGCESTYKAASPWSKFQIESMRKFKMTYIVDGATYEVMEVEYASEITVLDPPTKEGHTFSGWSEVPETMPANDVVISGTFTVNQYQVIFKIDGMVIANYTQDYGSAIVAPDAPEREGYTFSGWGDLPETVPASDVTCEGSYSVNSYIITYSVDGEVVHSESVAYGTTIIAPKEPTMEGHTFSGWSGLPETMPAEDVTVYGAFTVNKYLVTFKIGDEVIASYSLEYGATIVAPEAPEKEGHTFNGWGEVAETVPASDVTYEGTYSVNSYTITYSVDGEVVHSESVTYGTTIVASEEPIKEGHTFSGWSEVPETMPAKDVTITGTFTVNKYLVTFKIDDEVIASESLEYGATIVAPEAPEKEGHTFNGWGEVAETVPAGDVTYEGAYTVNIYKVYYYVGEELVHTVKVAYGEPIPEYIYEPTEEGYTFIGWVGETYATMPAHDVTYTANIDNGIGQLTMDSGQLTIYDFTGRKVTDTENLKGGIYIVNGRKVLIND